MANPEHVALLKQGSKSWNRWRTQNPSIQPDLSGENLSEACLFSMNLSHANLTGTQLFKANLLGSNLRNANLTNTDLRDSDLNGADLTEANLSNAKLSWVNLTKAKLVRATLNRADLSRANLSKADFSQAQVRGTNFQGAILTDACINNWVIDAATHLEGVVCESIFLKSTHSEHHPNQFMSSDEFNQFVQQLLDNVAAMS
ncbi:MAG: pentapeptide repeat-containing protein [Oculatellaceae cyanobacterium Prado106]|jgi:uncharacterized protein YjbI with pentapeptide repeats|nr:pentapeptide repeat-containing protein [Oculatellaceae cyanobacterium Prado106]